MDCRRSLVEPIPGTRELPERLLQESGVLRKIVEGVAVHVFGGRLGPWWGVGGSRAAWLSRTMKVGYYFHAPADEAERLMYGEEDL